MTCYSLRTNKMSVRRIRAILTWCLLASLTPGLVCAVYDMGQQCDWTGSGSGGGGVTPVYLRCREGTVRWRYPGGGGGGALRVVLQQGGGTMFRACIRPGPRFGGASLYLESSRSLVRLYSPEDANSGTSGKRRVVRCFQSGPAGRAALYLEPASPRPRLHHVAQFSYHLQPLPPGSLYDPTEECRPCTNEEMLHAFCTNELVVRGIIQRVEPMEGTDVSEMTVKVNKVLREAAWSENEISDSWGSVSSGSDGRRVVEVGRECGAQHGPDELIVMARLKLGRLTLSCAPRLHEWHHVLNQARRNNTAHCILAT